MFVFHLTWLKCTAWLKVCEQQNTTLIISDQWALIFPSLLSSFYSTRSWNTTAGICFWGTDFGLAVGVPDHWMFRSGLRAGQSSFSTPNSLNHFYFMDLALCTYIVVKLEQKNIFQKLLQESLRHIILWNSTVWWSIYFVFAEITNIAKLIN